MKWSDQGGEAVAQELSEGEEFLDRREHHCGQRSSKTPFLF